MFFSPENERKERRRSTGNAVLSMASFLRLIPHNRTTGFRKEIGSFLPLFEDFEETGGRWMIHSFFLSFFLGLE